MANLIDAIRQYPFLDALCQYLRIADFKALSRTSSDFRLFMTGRNRPTLPKQKTVYPFQPVSRPCICNKNLLADCPKHGPPELRSMLRKIDLTCEEPRHQENGGLSPSMPDDWKSAICDALGGLSNINSCNECTRTVCFPCWWLHITAGSANTRGNGRAQHACSTCWNTDFEKLHNDNPSRAFPAINGHHTWRQAQLQGNFCECGPAVLCRHCTGKVKAPRTYTPVEERSLLNDWYFRHRGRSSHTKCITCPTYMSEDGTEKVNYFCPSCNFPIQMRNYDHPVDRQSQKLGIYRDDGNGIDCEVRRVGSDYESVQEFCKQQWNRTGRLSDKLTNWQPVQYEWERINQASILTADEHSHFDRCSYFKPIRAPTWDYEKVLFEPPPLRLSINKWRRIYITQTWTMEDDPTICTEEEFLSGYGRGCRPARH